MKSWAGYIIAALGFVVYGAMTDADRDSSGAIVDAGTLDAFSIHVGDCFNDVDYSASQVSSVPGVPCSEPHDNEAFAVFDIDLASYPSQEEMSEISYGECLQRFESYVGRPYDVSSLEITTMYPSSASWAANDREIVCAVYDMNANKLVGSAQNSGL